MSAAENKALLLRWYEEASKGNGDFAYEAFAPDYVLQARRMPPRPEGAEGVKFSIEEGKNYTKDESYVIHHIIAEGDLVMIHATYTGTLVKDIEDPVFGTIKPTGKPASATVMRIYRFNENGKIIESWGMEDEVDQLLEIGTLKLIEKTPS